MNFFSKLFSSRKEKTAEDNRPTEESISFKSVKIGNQTWMTENLNIDTYSNGDPIQQIQNKDAWFRSTIGAWCYYENKGEYGIKYGKLYNWFAVNDPRGLAPKGWHIPAVTEWEQLFKYFGGRQEASTKIKSNFRWSDFDNGQANGTNESGFTGLPGGKRIDYRGPYSGDPHFCLLGNEGNWWSSTDDNDWNAWSVCIGARDIIRTFASNKISGFSVRCLKN